MNGVRAFREAFLSADTLDDSDFSDFEARRLRYAVLWAYYENTAYRDVHSWARKMRADFSLYKHVRNIYNPAFRLTNFWQTYLMGGALDIDSDGQATDKGALPIITDNDDLRVAIARLWLASNWQINKGIYTLQGPALGDAVLKVVDDTTRERVYLHVTHPGTLSDVELDAFGNVKSYVIQEEREDPRNPNKTVGYTEIAERDGDLVMYQTLLNNQPYPWNGESGEWEEPYGFVPMVVVQHNNVGLSWGWSEMHPALSKIREADDIASKLSDHIRKYVDPAWLMAGVTKPTNTPQPQGRDTSSERPDPAREEIPMFYGPAGADAKPLVAPLNIADSLSHVDGIVEELERDYPELKLLLLRMAGDASGEALRTAQEPVEQKVNMRRPNYDDGLRRAQQMAVAIGGFRGYEGYEGFGLESYAKGDLDHSIGPRPVFSASVEDELARDKMFWEAATAAQTAGVDLLIFLEQKGWTQEQLDKVANSSTYKNMTFGAYP